MSGVTTPNLTSPTPGSGAVQGGSGGTDATSTDAGHPALVTEVGSPAPAPGADPTGTDAAHPAIVSELGRI